jgi:hypothetical protein
LKEDGHSKKVTGVGVVSFLAASITEDPRLVGTHTACRVRFAQVGRVWHATAGLAVGFTSLRNRRDMISLHMAFNWSRVVCRFVVQVRGRMGWFSAKRDVVDPRTTTKIAIKQFNLAGICNFLGVFVNAEMIREVPNREAAVAVIIVLRALDGNDERFHDLH